MNLKINKLLTPYNFTDYNNTNRIKYIVIHYFGGLGTAHSVANYFYTGYRGASAHYCLDENNTVWQCVEDGDISWHCGDGGIGQYKGLCTNSNSIGIEVRPHKIDTSTSNDATKRDWYFDEQTTENLIEFTKYLMNKYNIDADYVIRHHDVTRKWCPRCWMGSDINTYYGISGNEMWRRFKQRLLEDDEMLSYEQFKDYMERYKAEINSKPEPQWSVNEGAWSKATENCVVNGKAPESPIKRCEIIAVLDRIGALDE